jgi:hypothetical protein
MGLLRKGGRGLIVVAVIVATLGALALTAAARSASDPTVPRDDRQHRGFGGVEKGRLAVTYGPYLGVRCRVPNSIRCDEVGIDVVLKEWASHVSASIAGRAISLTTPGFRNGVRGTDWVRPRLAHAGLMRRGSPLYVGDGKRRWLGDPPVYVPIRITATHADGSRRSTILPRVPLHAGWG